MKLNKKLLFFGAVLLILLWTGNIFYYEKHILKEPLFIKEYQDISSDMNTLQLAYLENINSQDKVTSIKFPELDTQLTYLDETDLGNDNKNYKLKALSLSTLNISSNKLQDQYKTKFITKAEINFSSGKVTTVNLGKIYFHGEGYASKIKNNDLRFYSSSASNNNSGSESFDVMKDLNITWIYSRFYDEIKDVLKITINDKDLSDITFPIKLNKGEPLNINYSFNFDKNDVRKNYIYNLYFYIFTEDSQGNKRYQSFYVNSNPPQSPDALDINLLKNHMEEN